MIVHGFIFSASSRFFSLNLGLIFIGVALGPAIGGLLLRTTGQVLSVFFLAAAIHATYALFVWFVVPEPLTTEQMQNSMKKHEERLHGSQHDHHTYRAATYIKRIFQFLSPLAIFIPSRKARTGKDWNLTLIALSYGLIYLILVRCLSSVLMKTNALFSRTLIMQYNTWPLLLVGALRL